jgi:hypothetical protein
MAQVGDVLMTARADVGQAKQAFRSLQTDIKQSSADFKAGIISIRDYQNALAAARQQAIGLRSAGLQPAGQELAAFNSILVATGPRLERARRGLGTMRGGLVSLAASTVGARGPLGALTSGLLLFGAGSTIGLGVAAGLAALAVGFHKIREGARDAAEMVKKYADAWRDLPEQQKVETGQNLVALQAQQAALSSRIIRERDRVIEGPDKVFLEAIRSANVKALEKQFIEVSKGVAGATVAVDSFGEAGRRAWEKIKDAFEQASKGIELIPLHAAEAIEEWSSKMQHQADVVRDALDPIRAYNREVQALRELEARGPLGLPGAITRAERLARQAQIGQEMFPVPDLADVVAPPWVKSKMKQDFDDLGLTAAGAFTRGFVRSAFEGFKGFGNVLKNIFASLFEDALIQALRRLGSGKGGVGGILGFVFKAGLGFVPGGSAIGGLVPGGGPGPRGSPVGPPEFSGMNINVGPARDPISIARDAQWLKALAESNLQLEAGGFRLARR